MVLPMLNHSSTTTLEPESLFIGWSCQVCLLLLHLINKLLNMIYFLVGKIVHAGKNNRYSYPSCIKCVLHKIMLRNNYYYYYYFLWLSLIVMFDYRIIRFIGLHSHSLNFYQHIFLLHHFILLLLLL